MSRHPEMLASSGEHITLWEVNENNQVSRKTTLNNVRCDIAIPLTNAKLVTFRPFYALLHFFCFFSAQNKNSEFGAPLTSFDWHDVDPNLIGTSSIDTTCTIWNVETGQARTQLIAHDKEVFDIAFARDPNHFASVGADGSVRMFDLRYAWGQTRIWVIEQWSREGSGHVSTLSTWTKVPICAFGFTMSDAHLPSHHHDHSFSFPSLFSSF